MIAGSRCRSDTEEEHGQRWQERDDRVQLIVVRNRSRAHPTEVTESTACIFAGIAVEDFLPKSGRWNSDAILLTGDGSEVADHDHGLLCGLAVAHK